MVSVFQLPLIMMLSELIMQFVLSYKGLINSNQLTNSHSLIIVLLLTLRNCPKLNLFFLKMQHIHIMVIIKICKCKLGHNEQLK